MKYTYLFLSVLLFSCAGSPEKKAEEHPSEEQTSTPEALSSSELTVDTLYYDDGSVRQILEYEDGSIRQIREYESSLLQFSYSKYHPNGKLAETGRQGNFAGCGILEGIRSVYDENGVLSETEEHEHFLREGMGCSYMDIVITINEYYATGKLRLEKKIETCYQCDECPCGLEIQYDKQGNEVQRTDHGDCYDGELGCLI